MKKIHPKLNTITVTCACGNSFTVKSTLSSLYVDLCNECHPFYTGKEKVLDVEGRVGLFNRRKAAAQNKSNTAKSSSVSTN